MAVSVEAAPVGVPTLRHRVADHAASGAMRDLLEHHGVSYDPHEPLSEGAVFGLSGAFDFRIRIAERAIPAIDFEGRAPSLELDLCNHLGLDARWYATDDPQAGWDRLLHELREGEPTLVRADPGELDYHRGRPHDTRHAVVVTGCDVPAGVAWVADRSFPEPQRCALSSLASARASRGWPEPARHGLLRMRRPPRIAEPAVAVGAALSRVVANMRHPARDGHPHVHSGLAGIDELAATWPRVPELAGALLGQTLAGLRFRIRDGGCGGALYSSLQARFLHEAAAIIPCPSLSRAALVCDDLADAWRALAAATEDDDAARAHQRCAPWIERIRTLEHRHIDELEQHLRE